MKLFLVLLSCQLVAVWGIQDGWTALNGKWKFMVSVSYVQGQRIHNCGGAMVTGEWVITAAKCIVGDLENPGNWRLNFGAWQITGPESYRVSRTPTQLHVHPNFNAADSLYDLALIKFDELDSNDRIEPIRLPRDDTENYTSLDCWTMGWGQLRWQDPEQVTDYLQESNAKFMSTDDCNKYWVLSNGTRLIRSDEFCSGTPIDPQEPPFPSACGQFDDGNPFVCNFGEDDAPEWHLAGITSLHDTAFCGLDLPPVYAQVKDHLTWIDETIIINS